MVKTFRNFIAHTFFPAQEMVAPKRLRPAQGKSVIMSPFSWAYLSLFFPEGYDLSAPQLVPLPGPLVPTLPNIQLSTEYFTGSGLLIVDGLQVVSPHLAPRRTNIDDKRIKLGVIIEFPPDSDTRSLPRAPEGLLFLMHPRHLVFRAPTIRSTHFGSCLEFGRSEHSSGVLLEQYMSDNNDWKTVHASLGFDHMLNHGMIEWGGARGEYSNHRYQFDESRRQGSGGYRRVGRAAARCRANW